VGIDPAGGADAEPFFTFNTARHYC
jgi:hypothetical protein